VDRLMLANPAEVAQALALEGALTLPDLNALLADKTHYWPIGGQQMLHGFLGWQAGVVRIKLAAGGWRSGKSRWTARELTFPLIARKDARAWIIGADYELARPEFEYVLEDIRALGYPVIEDLSMPQQGRWRMVLSNGSIIETQTAEDLRKIEAANLDILALTEAGGLPENLLTIAEGRLTEKRGLAILSGRFRGTFTWYTELFKLGQAPNARHCVSASLRTWDNKYFYPPCEVLSCTRTTSWPMSSPSPTHGGFHNDEIQYHFANKGEDEFGEMFAAEPRPDRSLVYADWWQRPTHYVTMDFEDKIDAPVGVVDAGRKIIGWRLPKAADVQVWIDPGYAGAYAVLAVQVHGREAFVIDELYYKGKVASDMLYLARQQWWWPYVKFGVIDIAGTQHHGQPSHTETWFDGGKGINLLSQRVLIPEGVERVRTMLRDPITKRPRLWVNAGPNGQCPMLAWELEAGYRYYERRHEADPRGEKEEPVATNNHACSALAYGLIHAFGKAEGMMEPRTIHY
jgi:hypothetical protein